MTDTNEKKWREECSKLEIPNQSVYDNFEWFYIKGRKKAHSENEDAFKAFTLDLADRYEKEITALKAEIDNLKAVINRGDEIKNNWENNEYQEAAHYTKLDDDNEKLQSQLEAANKVIEVQNVALEFYGSESLYMMREYETDMNLTSAVLKEEYRRNNDLSKPNTIKSFSYETTAKLKIDQGKTARQALAEVKKIRNGGEM